MHGARLEIAHSSCLSSHVHESQRAAFCELVQVPAAGGINSEPGECSHKRGRLILRESWKFNSQEVAAAR